MLFRLFLVNAKTKVLVAKYTRLFRSLLAANPIGHLLALEMVLRNPGARAFHGNDSRMPISFLLRKLAHYR